MIPSSEVITQSSVDQATPGTDRNAGLVWRRPGHQRHLRSLVVCMTRMGYTVYSIQYTVYTKEPCNILQSVHLLQCNMYIHLSMKPDFIEFDLQSKTRHEEENSYHIVAIDVRFTQAAYVSANASAHPLFTSKQD